MSMYIFLSLFICFSSLIFEVVLHSKKSRLFAFFLNVLIISLFVGFRYGQGNDYFSYMYIYESTGEFTSIVECFNANLHTEYLWKIINYFSNKFGLSYEAFIFVLSLFSSISLAYTVNKYVKKYRIFSLLLAYPSIYLVYFMSGIRQGMVLSIFLLCILKFFLNKEYTKCLTCILLCSLIHKSALVLVVLLIVPHLKGSYYKLMIFLSLIISITMLVITGNIQVFLMNSLLQFSERIIMYIIIIILYSNFKKKEGETDIMIRIYSVGVCIYLVLLFDSLLCTRITLYFKALEIFIIPNLLLYGSNKNKMIIYTAISAICLVISTKNINSFSVEGTYFFEGALSYPYVTVFNKNDIYLYRTNIYMTLLD